MSRGVLRSWLNRPISSPRRQRPAAKQPVAIEQLEQRELLATNPLNFDFGTSRSPVAPNMTKVVPATFTTTRGFGWQNLTSISAVDRGTADPATRDFHRGKNNTFLVTVPNGSYQVTAILGDPRSILDRVNIYAEGNLVASQLSGNAGATVASKFNVNVVDGRLNLQFRDTGGSNAYFSLAALNITPLSNRVPTANAGVDLTTSEGKAVTFNGTVANNQTAGLNFSWNFGDGTEESGTLTPTHVFKDNGTYTVTLKVSDANGAFSSDTAVVKVANTVPTVSLGGPLQAKVNTPFLFAPSVADAGLADQAAGFKYLWNFGNRTSSSLANPSKTYNAPGTYTVSLKVTDKDGGATTVKTTVKVAANLPGLVVNAGADMSGQEGSEVRYAGSATGGTNLTALWDFGDGTQGAAGWNVAHTYRDNGVYTATLIVTNQATGVSASDTLKVTIANLAPSVNAGGPYSGLAGDAVNFVPTVKDAGAVDEAAGLTHLWNFGDGTTSSLANPSHAYSAPGSYQASLTVTDKDGASTTGQTTIQVTSKPVTNLVVSAGVDKGSREGTPHTFVGTATGGTSLNYLWDFGDGSQATGTLSPSHAYRDSGVYNVTLTVTDTATGVSASDSLSATVENVAPSASAGGPYSAPVGTAINFVSTVNDPSSIDQAAGFRYLWNFGDGTTSSSDKPSHAYTTAGNYNVTLTVTDKDGGATVVNTSASVGQTTSATLPNVSSLVGAWDLRTSNPLANLKAPGTMDATVIGSVPISAEGAYISGNRDMVPADNKIEIMVPAANVPHRSGALFILAKVDPQALAHGGTIGVGSIFGHYHWAMPTLLLHYNDSLGAEQATSLSGYYGTNPESNRPDIVDGSAPIQGSQWVTIGVTWQEGQDARLYVNGVLDAVIPTPREISAIEPYFGGQAAIPLHLGSADYLYHTGDAAFSGNIGAAALSTLKWSDADAAAFHSWATRQVPPSTGGGLTANAGADQTANEGQTVAFTGSVAGASGQGTPSYLWNFGDGSQATGTLTPTHIYRDNGTYNVTLTVTDAQGTSVIDSAVVRVNNLAPTVNAGGPYRGNLTSAVAFFANVTDASSVDQGTGFRYLWNFGDGTTSTAANPSHQYASVGTYTVSLTVTDKDNAATTAQTSAIIDTTTPSGLSANAGPDQTANEGQAVFFAGTVSGASPAALSYLWDFGDGSSGATSLNPSHVFRDNGRFTVTLTVTGPGGVTARDSAVVTVNNVAPSISLGGPYAARVNTVVAFTPGVSDSPADQAAGFTYLWNFGDGTTSTAANPTHTYGALGTYTVTMTVTDKDGASGTVSASVLVSVPVDPGNFIQTRHDKIPNFGLNPTIQAVTSGAWSNPSTWSLGRLPGANDIVSIGNNKTVTYDLVNDTPLKTVAIQSGGHLTFRTDINTRIIATNYLVMEGGALTMGTAANPVAANVKAEMLITNTPLDLINDPAQWGNSLIVLGRFTSHGANKSQSFVRLAVEPRAGSTTLTLAQPVSGWQAGDKVVIPDSRLVRAPTESDLPGTQMELLTIASVSADGRTITLTTPLQFDHVGARDAAGNLDFLPHVGNITRNVVVKSQSSSGVRGIVVFTENAEVDVRYTGFGGLGRSTVDAPDNTTFDASGAVTHVGTNQQDRYPVQFRHLTDRGATGTPRFTFDGNSIFCGLPTHRFRWALTVIDSHNGHIGNNMLYNWAGVAFMVPGIDEGFAESRKNVIENNFSVRVRTNGVSRDFGNEGAGFEFHGIDNYIRGNVSANADHYGFQAFGGTTGYLEFSDNEAYGGRDGMTMWYINGASTGASNPDAPFTTIRNFSAWHHYEFGIGQGYPSYNLIFENFKARNDPVNPWGMGFNFGDYHSKDFIVRNPDIQGFKFGIEVPMVQHETNVGTLPNQWFTVEGGLLRNYFNIYYPNTAGAIGAGSIKAHGAIIRGVRFGNLPQAPAFTRNDGTIIPQSNIYMDARLEGTGFNFTAGNYVYVYDYNGVPGANFRVYFHEQAANFILPQTRDEGATIGSPEAGLTNLENWQKYRIAFSGEIAPSTAVDGLSRGILGGLINPM